MGTTFGVTCRAIFLSSAASKSSSVPAFFSPSAAWPVNFWSVCSASHLARSAGLASSSASRLIVAGAPCDLVGLMAIDRALGHLQVEAHHRFVHAADLLHVQRAVAEPLAVEDQQVAEHAENDTVGDMRDVQLLVRLRGATSTARPSRNG